MIGVDHQMSWELQERSHHYKLSSDMETDLPSDHLPPEVEIEEVRTSNSQPH